MSESSGSLLWLLLIQLIFIFLNAIFASAEIAVIAMNDKKLAKLTSAGDKRAIRLTKLTEQPAVFLATIQVGITLVNLLSSAVATGNFAGRLTDWLVTLGINIPLSIVNLISVVIITIALTYFTVLLGELIPKRLAMRNAENIALSMSGLIYRIAKLFTPAVWLFTVSTNGILRLFKIDPNAIHNENAEEEIRMILDAGQQSGMIDPEEQSMIHNIFEFDDTYVREIMTHRTEVALLWSDESDEQWEQTIIESSHSIYPVCGESPDHILGVLYTKDYLRLKDRSRKNVMKNAVHKAHFIPESVHCDVLFRHMKKTRNHFAVITDEFGGMSGIVTMNDLLEELVGDIDDDFSKTFESPLIERLDSKTWKIRGTAPLDDISKQLGVDLPDTRYDTFGGLVFGILGAVPQDGSTPEIEEFGLQIKVKKIKDRRLELALVYLTEPQDEEE